MSSKGTPGSRARYSVPWWPLLLLPTGFPKAAFALVLLFLWAACADKSTLEHTIAETAATLPEIRQLDFLEGVQANFVSSQEMADLIQEQLDQANRDELANLQELYLTLELIDPDLELYSLYLDLLKEQAVGLFDTETEELYVVTGRTEIGTAEELTLAHELTHALQQQHFDIQVLLEGVKGNLDRELALASLAEGDATLAEVLYQQAQSLPFPEVPASPVFDSAPAIVQDTLIFPYLDGTDFVISLWQDDQSWDRVDAAYLSPPTSTEQVLHPEKYLAGENPVQITIPDPLPALGEGWELIFSDVAGEFLLKSYLGNRLPLLTAQKAAAGWGGDRFTLYRNQKGQRILMLLVQWDTTKDAREFFTAYEEFNDIEVEWQHHDKGVGNVQWGRLERWIYLGRVGDRVVIILTPSEVELDRLQPLFPAF